MFEVRDLAVPARGRHRARRLADLALQAGEIVALTGDNGAGKTTLLLALAGLLDARGEIRLEDRIDGLPPEARVRRGLALVPEGRHLFGPLTVEENLHAGAWTGRGAPEPIFPVLADRLRQRADTLSGGEQQMLAVARALASRPKVLLLDEPTLGLAGPVIDTLADHLARLAASGVAILVASPPDGPLVRAAHRTLPLTPKRGQAPFLTSDQKRGQAPF